MFFHCFKQRERSAEVVAVVHQRLTHAFGYCLIARKMYHCLDIIFGEYLLHIRLIAHIGFIEFEIPAAYLFYQLNRFGLGIVEIIHYYDLFACLEEFDTGVRAYIACSAGN